MHNIPFYKISPSGNMTVLFEGLQYNKQERSHFATQGLLPSHIGGEQAGFIDIKSGVLQMAGGEFCINATRSLALLMALEEKFNMHDTPKTPDNITIWQGKVQSSGFDFPLLAHVQQSFIHTQSHCSKLSKAYDVALHIPLMHLPTMQNLDQGITLVCLPGISHLLIDEEHFPFNINNWQVDAKIIREKYNLEREAAIGCIWWHEVSQKKLSKSKQNSYEIFMHPIVLVQNPFAEHYENACGSGALALGLWHYAKHRRMHFTMQQPGGYLTLSIQEDIDKLETIIGGPVNVVAQGIANFYFP